MPAYDSTLSGLQIERADSLLWRNTIEYGDSFELEDLVSGAGLPGPEILPHELRHRAIGLLLSCALIGIPGCWCRPGCGASRWKPAVFGRCL